MCDTGLGQKGTSIPAVPTFSQSLDNILGGHGVKLGTLTEIIGAPSSGKTQLCLQLSASVQIPKELGGLDAEALYIDTNRNFTHCRFTEILSASLMRCQTLMTEPIQTTEEEALKKLHHVKAIGLERYCTLLYMLPKFIKAHPNIKLIVIDSIAHPFTNVAIDPRERTAILLRHMCDLKRVAVRNQIAVVLTNEFSLRHGRPSCPMVSALGESWSHYCNTRIMLSNAPYEPSYIAMPRKSNKYKLEIAKFLITQEGIRDVVVDSLFKWR